MVRIAWRDLAGKPAVAEVLAETSAFADVAVASAVAHATRELAHTYGTPLSAAVQPQPLIVLGMGKLGGGELNFSSDLDLIFVFPEKGETSGPRRIDNEDFFTRLGRLVIRILGERTSEGIVHRVDMRLRPFGDSADGQRRLPRHLPADPWSRLGALCLDQGARADRHGRVQAAARGDRAPVRVSPLPRFRRVRIAARDEGSDREGSGAA
jgi:hypothetical protein